MLIVVVLFASLLAACSLVSGRPAPTALPQPTQTPAPPSSTPTPLPSDVPTAVQPAVSATSTTVQLSPSPAPTLAPSPTSLALLNVAIEGGDPNNKFYAMLVYPDYQPEATTSLWFRVYAHKPSESKVDGDGIATVDFVFLDSNGNQVYERLEKTAGYCAFVGGEPDCTVWVFADNKNAWPNGTKMLSGAYTLKVNVTAIDQTVMFGETTFRIQVP